MICYEMVSITGHVNNIHFLFIFVLNREAAEGHAGTEGTDVAELGTALAAEREALASIRLRLARSTRVAASLQRQLDDVPGRAELAQYQRRFLELYSQVAAKHKETKQFYTLYDTLSDKKLYRS